MTRTRLEAFSDAVIAIVLTLMVLDLKVPRGTDWAALLPVVPAFLTYVLSFIYLAIYWNNHHHLFQLVQKVDGRVLWANLYVLFWLSLFPFVTAWADEHHFAPTPTAAYGVVLWMTSLAWILLEKALVAIHGPDSLLAKALRRKFKERASALLYAVAIPLAFVRPWISASIYVLVALMWLIPDRRVESILPHE